MSDFALSLPLDIENMVETSEKLWNIDESSMADGIEGLINDIQQSKLDFIQTIKLIDTICMSRPKKIKLYADICEAIFLKVKPQDKKLKMQFYSTHLRSALVKKNLIEGRIAPEFEKSPLDSIYEFYPKGTLEHALFWDEIPELYKFISDPYFNINSQIGDKTLISKTAEFGSVNCFKFLYLNRSEIVPETIENSFIGNDYEIIHICERHSKITNECIENSVKSHHNETVSYLMQKYGLGYKWESALSAYNYRLFFDKLSNARSIDEIDYSGESAFIASTSVGHFGISQYLLSNSSDINFKDIHGFSPLLNATIEGNIEAVQFLLKNRANTEVRDLSNRTALMLASEVSELVIMEILLANDANIEAVDSQGNTALHHAVRFDQIESVKILLDHNANLNACNSLNETPIYIAVAEGNFDMALLLLQFQPNLEIPNYIHFTPLMKAAFDNKADITNILILHKANVHAKDPSGYNALMLAAYNNSIDVANILLKFNCLDVRGSLNVTPLIIASQRGSLDMVQLLVKSGVELDQTTIFGNTALMEAISNGHHKVVRFLLESGSNPAIRNNNRESVLDIANKTGRRLLVEMVENYLL